MFRLWLCLAAVCLVAGDTLYFRSQVPKDIICGDNISQCPDGTTCCMMPTGDYGCCPLPNAVCCLDKLHCCPNGHTCDVKDGTCNPPKGAKIPWLEKTPAHARSTRAQYIICGGGEYQCPNGYTCCPQPGGAYGCCPFPQATCCSDGEHCCPHTYTCDLSHSTCVKLLFRLGIRWQKKLTGATNVLLGKIQEASSLAAKPMLKTQAQQSTKANAGMKVKVKEVASKKKPYNITKVSKVTAAPAKPTISKVRQTTKAHETPKQKTTPKGTGKTAPKEAVPKSSAPPTNMKMKAKPGQTPPFRKNMGMVESAKQQSSLPKGKPQKGGTKDQFSKPQTIQLKTKSGGPAQTLKAKLATAKMNSLSPKATLGKTGKTSSEAKNGQIEPKKLQTVSKKDVGLGKLPTHSGKPEGKVTKKVQKKKAKKMLESIKDTIHATMNAIKETVHRVVGSSSQTDEKVPTKKSKRGKVPVKKALGGVDAKDSKTTGVPLKGLTQLKQKMKESAKKQATSSSTSSSKTVPVRSQDGQPRTKTDAKKNVTLSMSMAASNKTSPSDGKTNQGSAKEVRGSSQTQSHKSLGNIQKNKVEQKKINALKLLDKTHTLKERKTQKEKQRKLVEVQQLVKQQKIQYQKLQVKKKLTLQQQKLIRQQNIWQHKLKGEEIKQKNIQQYLILEQNLKQQGKNKLVQNTLQPKEKLKQPQQTLQQQKQKIQQQKKQGSPQQLKMQTASQQHKQKPMQNQAQQQQKQKQAQQKQKEKPAQQKQKEKQARHQEKQKQAQHQQKQNQAQQKQKQVQPQQKQTPQQKQNQAQYQQKQNQAEQQKQEQTRHQQKQIQAQYQQKQKQAQYQQKQKQTQHQLQAQKQKQAHLQQKQKQAQLQQKQKQAQLQQKQKQAQQQKQNQAQLHQKQKQTQLQQKQKQAQLQQKQKQTQLQQKQKQAQLQQKQKQAQLQQKQKQAQLQQKQKQAQLQQKQKQAQLQQKQKQAQLPQKQAQLPQKQKQAQQQKQKQAQHQQNEQRKQAQHQQSQKQAQHQQNKKQAYLQQKQTPASLQHKKTLMKELGLNQKGVDEPVKLENQQQQQEQKQQQQQAHQQKQQQNKQKSDTTPKKRSVRSSANSGHMSVGRKLLGLVWRYLGLKSAEDDVVIENLEIDGDAAHGWDFPAGMDEDEEFVVEGEELEIVEEDAIALVADVKCPDKSVCPGHTTCCQLADGAYGCCPMSNAVCCPDHIHCCSEGEICDVAESRCKSKAGVFTSKLRRKFPSAAPVTATQEVTCKDSDVTCPSGATCCLVADGNYACCPLPNAVCCADHLHCCPKDYTCRPEKAQCIKGRLAITWMLKTPARPKDIRNQTPKNEITKNKVTASSLICPDRKSTCPTGSTCCILRSGKYGCCPMNNAVCCADKLHCCPEFYTCDVKAATCLHSKASVPWSVKRPAGKVHIGIMADIVCPDRQSMCPDEATCCKMASGSWGCCPMPNAVCCSDRKHCCPSGSRCNTAEGTCIMNKSNISISYTPIIPRRKVEAKMAMRHKATIVKCKDNTECPDGSTCCVNSAGKYACCPHSEATCCSDKLHCCPSGYTCGTSAHECKKGSTTISADFIARVLAKKPHKWQVAVADIKCPDESSCPNSDTCCALVNGMYGCCPLPNATCCKNGFCCPVGTKCDASSHQCITSLPWSTKAPSSPIVPGDERSFLRRAAKGGHILY